MSPSMKFKLLSSIVKITVAKIRDRRIEKKVKHIIINSFELINFFSADWIRKHQSDCFIIVFFNN